LHFLNCKVSEMNKNVNHIWSCMWIVVVDELWKHKNKKIFNSGRIDHIEIFSMVQLKV